GAGKEARGGRREAEEEKRRGAREEMQCSTMGLFRALIGSGQRCPLSSSILASGLLTTTRYYGAGCSPCLMQDAGRPAVWSGGFIDLVLSYGVLLFLYSHNM